MCCVIDILYSVNYADPDQNASMLSERHGSVQVNLLLVKSIAKLKVWTDLAACSFRQTDRKAERQTESTTSI